MQVERKAFPVSGLEKSHTQFVYCQVLTFRVGLVSPLFTLPGETDFSYFPQGAQKQRWSRVKYFPLRSLESNRPEFEFSFPYLLADL